MFSPEALKNPLFRTLLTEWALAKCSYQVEHLKHEQHVAKYLQNDRRRRIAKRKHLFGKIQERQLEVLRSQRDVKKERDIIENINDRIKYLTRKYFDIWCRNVKGKKVLCNDLDCTFKTAWDVTDGMRTMNDYLLHTCKHLDQLKSHNDILQLIDRKESERIKSEFAMQSENNEDNRLVNSNISPRRASIHQPKKQPPGIFKIKSTSHHKTQEKQKLPETIVHKLKPRFKSSPRCEAYRFFQPCRRSKVYDLTCGGCYPLERWRATDCHGMFQRPITPMPCCLQKKPFTLSYEEPCNPCRIVKPVSTCEASPEGVCFESKCVQFLQDENMLDCDAPKCTTEPMAKCSSKRPIHKRKTCFKSVMTPTGRCTTIFPKLVCDVGKPCKKRPRKQTCSYIKTAEEEPKCDPIRTGYLSKKCQVPPISCHPLFRKSCVTEHFTQTKPKRCSKRPRAQPSKDAGTRTYPQKRSDANTEPIRKRSPVNKDTQTPNVDKPKSKPRPIRNVVPTTTASQTDPKKAETASSQTSPIPVVFPGTAQTNKPPKASPKLTQTDKPAKVSPEGAQTNPPATLISNDTQTVKPAKVAPEQTQTVTEVPKPAQTETSKASTESSQTEPIPEKTFAPQSVQTQPGKTSEQPIQTDRNIPAKIHPETSQTDPTPENAPALTQTKTVQFSPEMTQTEIKEPVSQPIQTKPADFTSAFGQTDPKEIDSTPAQTESLPPPTKVVPQTTQTPQPPTPAKVHPETQQTDNAKSISDEVQTDPTRTQPETTQTPKPKEEIPPVPQTAKVPPAEHLEVQTEKTDLTPQLTQTEKPKPSPQTFSQTNPPPSVTPETMQTDTTDLTLGESQTNTPPTTVPQPTQTDSKRKTTPESTQYEPKEPLDQQLQTEPIDSSPQQSQTEPMKTPSPKPAEAQTKKPPESTVKPTQTPSPEPKPTETQTPKEEIPKTTESHTQPEPASETAPQPSQTEPMQNVPQDSQTVPEQAVPQTIQTEPIKDSPVEVQTHPLPEDTQPSQTDPINSVPAGSQVDAAPPKDSTTSTVQTDPVPVVIKDTQADPQVTTPNTMQTDSPGTTSGISQGDPIDTKSGTVQTDPPTKLSEYTQAVPLQISPGVTQTDPGNEMISGTTQTVPPSIKLCIVQTEPLPACPEVVQTQVEPASSANVQTLVTATRPNYTEPEPLCSSPSEAAVQTEQTELAPVGAQTKTEAQDPSAAQTEPTPVIHQPAQTFSVVICDGEMNTQTCQTPYNTLSVQTIGPCISVVPCQANVPTYMDSSQTEKQPHKMALPAITQSVSPETQPMVVQTEPTPTIPEVVQTQVEPRSVNVQTKVTVTRLNGTEPEPSCSSPSTAAVQTERTELIPTVVQTDTKVHDPAEGQTEATPTFQEPTQTSSVVLCNSQMNTETCKPTRSIQCIQTIAPCISVVQCQTCVPLCVDGSQTEKCPEQTATSITTQSVPPETNPCVVQTNSTPVCTEVVQTQPACPQILVVKIEACTEPTTTKPTAQCTQVSPSPGIDCQTVEQPSFAQCTETMVNVPSEKSYQTETQVNIEDCSQTPCKSQTITVCTYPPCLYSNVCQTEHEQPAAVICTQTCVEHPACTPTQTGSNSANENCSQTLPNIPTTTAHSQTCTSKIVHILTNPCLPCVQENSDQTESVPFENFAQTDKPCEEAEIAQTEIAAENGSQTVEPCKKDEVSQRSIANEAASAQTQPPPSLEQCVENDPANIAEESAQTCSPITVETSALTETPSAAGQTEIIPGCEGFAQTQPPCCVQICAQTTYPCVDLHSAQTSTPCAAQAHVQTPVLVRGITFVQTDKIAPSTEERSQTEKPCPNVEGSQTVPPPLIEDIVQTESTNENTETEPALTNPEFAQTETPKPPEKGVQNESILKAQDCSQTPCPPESVDHGQGNEPPRIMCIQTCHEIPVAVQSQTETCKPQMVTKCTYQPCLQSEQIVQTNQPVQKTSKQTDPEVVAVKNIPTQITPETKEASQTSVFLVCPEQCIQTTAIPRPDSTSQTNYEPPCETQFLQTDPVPLKVCVETEPIPILVTCTPAQVIVPTKEVAQSPCPPIPIEQCVQVVPIPKPGICCQTMEPVSCFQIIQTEIPKPKICAETDASPPPTFKSTPTQMLPVTTEACTEHSPPKPTTQCTQICPPPNPGIDSQTCGPCCLICVQTDAPNNPVICCQTCGPPCCSQLAQTNFSSKKICTHTEPAPIQLKSIPTQMFIPTKDSEQSPAPPVPIEQCIQICPQPNPESICQTCTPIFCIDCVQTDPPKSKVCAETEPDVTVKSTPTQMLIPTTETSQGPEPPDPSEQCHQTEAQESQPVIETQTCKPPCCEQVIQTEISTLPVMDCQTCIPCCLEATQTDPTPTKICVQIQPVPPEIICTPTQVTIPTKDTSQGPIPPAPAVQSVQTSDSASPAIDTQTCKPPCTIQCIQTIIPPLPQKCFQTDVAKKVEDCCQTPCLPESAHRGEGKEPPGVICIQTCCEPPAFNFAQTDTKSEAEQCSQTIQKLPNTSQSQTDPCLPHVSTYTSPPCPQEVCDQTENSPEAENFSQTENPQTSTEIAQTLDTSLNFTSQVEKPCTQEQISQKSSPTTEVHDAQTDAKIQLEQFSQNEPFCMPEVTSQTCPPKVEPTCAQTETTSTGDQTDAIPGCENLSQTQPPCPEHVFAQTLPPCLAVCCVQTIRPCPTQSSVQTPIAIQEIICTQTEVNANENCTQIEKPCPQEEVMQTEPPPLTEGIAQTEYNNETTETTPAKECEGFAQTDKPVPKEAPTQSQDSSNRDVQTSAILRAEECAQVEESNTEDNNDQTCSPESTEQCAQTEQIQESAQTDKEEFEEISVQTERPCPGEAPAQTTDPECVGRSDQTNELPIQENCAQTMKPCHNDYFTQTCSPPMLEALAQAEFIKSECLQTESPCGTQVCSQTCPKLQIIHCVQTVNPCPVQGGSQTPNPVCIPSCIQVQTFPVEGFAQTKSPSQLEQCDQTCPPTIAEEFAQTETNAESAQTEKSPELEGSAQTEEVCPVDTSDQTPEPGYDVHCAQTELSNPEDKHSETVKTTGTAQCAQTETPCLPEKSPQTEQPGKVDEVTQICSPESSPESAQTDSSNVSLQTDTAPAVEVPAQTHSESPTEVGEQTCQPEISEVSAQTCVNTDSSQTEPAPTLEHTAQVSPCPAEGTSQTINPTEESHFAQTTQKCTVEQFTLTQQPVVTDSFAQGEYKPECLQTEPISAAEGPSQTEQPCPTDQSHQTCPPEVLDACAQTEFNTECCQTEITTCTIEAITQTELSHACESFSQTCRPCRVIRCTQTCVQACAEGFTQTSEKCPVEQVAQTEQASHTENCTQTIPTEHLIHSVQTKPPCPHGQHSQTDPTPAIETCIQTVLISKTGAPTQTNDEVGESCQTEKSVPCEEFTQTHVPVPAEMFVQTDSTPAEQFSQTVPAAITPIYCQTEILPLDEASHQTEKPIFEEICTTTEIISKCGQNTQSESPPVDTTCTQIIVPNVDTQTHVPASIVCFAQTVAPAGTHKCSQSDPAKEAWSQRNEPTETRAISLQACKSMPDNSCKSIQTNLLPSRNVAVDCCPHIHTKLNSCQAGLPPPSTACCSMQTYCCKPQTISVVCSCPDIRSMKDMETGVNQPTICCTSMQTPPSCKPKTFSVLCGGPLPNQNLRVIDMQTIPTTSCASMQTILCRKPKTTSIICGNPQPHQQTRALDIQTWALNPMCCASMQTPLYSKPQTMSVDCGTNLQKQTRAMDIQTWAMNPTCCSSMQTPIIDKPKTASIDCGNQQPCQQGNFVDMQTGATDYPGSCCISIQTPICDKPKTISVDCGNVQPCKKSKAMDIQAWAINQACCGTTVQIPVCIPRAEQVSIDCGNSTPNPDQQFNIVNKTNESKPKTGCATDTIKPHCIHKSLTVDCRETIQSHTAKLNMQTCTTNPSVCCRTMQTPAFQKPETKSVDCNIGPANKQTNRIDIQSLPVNPSICCKWMQTPIFNPATYNTDSSSVQPPTCSRAITPTLITMCCKSAQIPKSDTSNSMSDVNQIQYVCQPAVMCSTQQTINVPCSNATSQSPATACPSVKYPSATQLQHLMHRAMRNILTPRECMTTSASRNISTTRPCPEDEADRPAHATPPANVYAETAILKVLSGCSGKGNKESQIGASTVTPNVMEDIVIHSSQVSLVGDILTERAVLRTWKAEGPERKRKLDQATSPLASAIAIDHSNLEESQLASMEVHENNRCADNEQVSDRLAKIKTELMALKENLAKEGIGNLASTSHAQEAIIPQPRVSPPERFENPELKSDKRSRILSDVKPGGSILKSNKPTPRSSKCPLNIFNKISSASSGRKVRISKQGKNIKTIPETDSALKTTEPKLLGTNTPASLIESPLPENALQSDQSITQDMQTSVHANDSSRALSEDPFQEVIPASKSIGFEVSDGPNALQSSTYVLMRPKEDVAESRSAQFSSEEREDQEALKTWVETVDAEKKKKQELQERLKNVKEQVDSTREELERRGIIKHGDPKHNKQKDHAKGKKK